MGQKLGHTTNSGPGRECKGKVVGGNSGCLAVNRRTIREQNSLIADAPKVCGVGLEEQTSHDVPLSQSLTLSQAPTRFGWAKAESSEEAAGGPSAAGRGGSERCKGRRRLCNIRVRGEAARAGVDAAASSPGDPAG